MDLSNSELYAKWNRWLAQIMPDDLTHVKYRLKNMLLACICLYKAGHVHLSHIAGSSRASSRISLTWRSSSATSSRLARPRRRSGHCAAAWLS
jgi:hypothetical protein